MAATPRVQAFARDAVRDPTLLVGRVRLLRRVAALDAIDGRLKRLAVRVADLHDPGPL